MNSVLGGGLKYYYGGRNASHNRIGRLMMREDGTGAIEYFYGKMGEVTKTRRTLIVPNQAIATYVTQWTYDSHNRLLEMIYPDEEKVTYSYNLGGLLEKVRGEKSYGYDYITKLGYDKFEQRSYLKYCNGAETFYTYDNRRRLSNLAVNSGNTAIMDNDYTFDAVSNVLSVANNASLPASGNAGGKMSHTYTYDGLYRLATATGTYTGADSKSASYTLAMGYDNMHRITSKSQHLTQDNVQFNGTLNVGYDLTYTYGTEAGKKFQLASVKDVNYRTEETPGDNKIENNHVYLYDKNGNLIYVNTGRLMNDGHNETGTGERKLIWDEENRLLAVDDNGFVSNYWYDADGERTVKTSGESDQVYVNGVFSGGSTNTAKFSLYVSPYLVANQGGRYTKHIYAGSQRIVSKIGDFASYGSDPRRIEYAGANTDGLSVDYKAKYAAQQQVIKDNYKFFDVPYNGTDNDNYADGEGFCCNDGSMEAAVAEARKAQSRAVARSFKDPDNYENLQFFYHPDHLGSSSFITNLEGEVVQHIEYVPFGEVFIEERNSVWNTPYLFNAKEFDEETGMYYYGARYYEPRLSIWMSTDPMQEDFANASTYHYTLNNPIRYIEYDGNTFGDYRTSTITYQYGVFRINVSRLHKVVRNELKARNENPAYWNPGEIGINLTVGEFKPIIPAKSDIELSLDNTSGAPDPASSPNRIQTKAVNAKSTGLPDRRIKPRMINSGSPGFTRGTAWFALAVNVLSTGYNIYAAWCANADQNAINRDVTQLRSAVSAVTQAARDGVIPQKYLTPDGLSAITNVVYQGINVTKDPQIMNIGIKILKINGVYDPKKIKRD